MPEPMKRQIAALPSDCLLDGEAIGDTLMAFDILSFAGTNIRKLTYIERYALLSGLPQGLGYFVIAPLFKTKPEKEELLRRLRSLNAEGIVFKRADAPYVPGRPASGGSMVKFKFTATASCVVGAGRVGKRSIALRLRTPSGDEIDVGNCTIPSNKEVPQVGSVADIRYLYSFPQGSLFQPVYIGPRDDITPAECVTTQLKYKKGSSNEEGDS